MTTPPLGAAPIPPSTYESEGDVVTDHKAVFVDDVAGDPVPAAFWVQAHKGRVDGVDSAATQHERLTSNAPEPPAGSIVIDVDGLRWRRNATLDKWFLVPTGHPDDLDDDDPRTWVELAGNYGPVTLACGCGKPWPCTDRRHYTPCADPTCCPGEHEPAGGTS